MIYLVFEWNSPDGKASGGEDEGEWADDEKPN
jgi:hypothetical protein